MPVCAFVFIDKNIKQPNKNNLRNLAICKLLYTYGGIYLDIDTICLKSFSDLLNNDFNVIVYNFIDMLSHARTDMEVIRELADDEKAYRSLTSSWFDNSPLLEVIKKHGKEKFLFPCSNIRKGDIPDFMTANEMHCTEAVIYCTIASDLSDLADVKYDILAFFSPSGIKSLKQNFPDFVQGKTRIAAFGPTTAQAVHDMELILDIEAPMPNAPSMTGALELFIKKANNL